MKALMALIAGTVFGVGLAMSGMTDTAKVTGFLDLFGNWIPDLAFVMGGALAGAGRGARAAVALPAVVAFAVLTGAPGSVVRAGGLVALRHAVHEVMLGEHDTVLLVVGCPYSHTVEAGHPAYDVVGDAAYSLAVDDALVAVYDVTDPTQPQELAPLPLPASPGSASCPRCRWLRRWPCPTG